MTILLYRLNDNYCIQKQIDGMQDGNHMPHGLWKQTGIETKRKLLNIIQLNI